MKCQKCLKDLDNRFEEDRGLCLLCFNIMEREWEDVKLNLALEREEEIRNYTER